MNVNLLLADLLSLSFTAQATLRTYPYGLSFNEIQIPSKTIAIKCHRISSI